MSETTDALPAQADAPQIELSPVRVIGVHPRTDHFERIADFITQLTGRPVLGQSYGAKRYRKILQPGERMFVIHKKLEGQRTRFEPRGYTTESSHIYLGVFGDEAEARAVGEEWQKTGKKPKPRKAGGKPADAEHPNSHQVNGRGGLFWYAARGTKNGKTTQFGHFETRAEAQAAWDAYKASDAAKPPMLTRGLRAGTYRIIADANGKRRVTTDPEEMRQADEAHRKNKQAAWKRSNDRRLAKARKSKGAPPERRTRAFIAKPAPVPQAIREAAKKSEAAQEKAATAASIARASRKPLTADQMDEIKERARSLRRRFDSLLQGAAPDETVRAESLDFVTIRAEQADRLAEALKNSPSLKGFAVKIVEKFVRITLSAVAFK